MTKLRHPRRLALSAIAVAVMLAAAAPAAAETFSESPGGPAEPAPEVTPPPSTGWIPQSPSPEASGDGSQIRRGSSLGSGGAQSQPEPSGEEPSYIPPDSSGYESESPASPTVEEEAVSTLEGESTSAPVQPRPAEPAPPKGKTAVGAATALTRPEMQRVAGVNAESPTRTAALANQAEPVSASGSSGLLWWIAVIVCGCLLVYAAARLLLEPTEPFKR